MFTIYDNFSTTLSIVNLLAGSLTNMCLTSLAARLLVILSMSYCFGKDFLLDGGLIPYKRRVILSPSKIYKKTIPKDHTSVRVP